MYKLVESYSYTNDDNGNYIAVFILDDIVYNIRAYRDSDFLNVLKINMFCDMELFMKFNCKKLVNIDYFNFFCNCAILCLGEFIITPNRYNEMINFYQLEDKDFSYTYTWRECLKSYELELVQEWDKK